MHTKLLDMQSQQGKEFRRTVLIVDDEEVNLRIMGKILGDEYDLIYAKSGEEALEIIRERRDFLSLILLDLYMGGMHGFEVMDIIRSDDDLKNIPIIVLTVDKEAEVESLQRGAVDFLSKPFDHPSVVQARVGKAIELSVDRTIIDNTGIDPLTGLFTKQYFRQYMVEYNKFHPEQPVDAIVVDINKFHVINELYGRAFGNRILKEIAGGLNDVAEKCGGVAGRVDADLFYLLIEHQEEYDELVKEMKKYLGDIIRPSDVKLRVGIYQDIDHSVNIYQRFDKARMACNSDENYAQANAFVVYDASMHERELYEARLLENIEQAFKEKQFFVVLQPKYNITGDEPYICSAEVLVRWNHPKFGMVRPDDFIPLFESNGLIKELDRYVWNEAASILGQLRKKNCKLNFLSVNVSRIDVFDPDLCEYLQGITKENGILPDELHLEITETAYTDSVSQLFQVVKELRDKNFKIEMDDFGKGYSSLNMLTSLPIDVLKLDMGFIRHISENNLEMKMVEFIIAIGQMLKVPVVAEGVETKEQYDLLKKAGCSVIQGYYFSKPVSVEEFEKLVQ